MYKVLFFNFTEKYFLFFLGIRVSLSNTGSNENLVTFTCWSTKHCQLFKKVSQIKINFMYAAICFLPVGDITSYPLEEENKHYYSIKSLLQDPNLV